LFIGNDGVPYEVRGEPGSIFNLVSSARFSINAEFVAVPERFRAEDITETVLGSIGVSYCAGTCEGRLVFNVTTGQLNTTHQAEGACSDGGVQIVLQSHVCDLRTLSCEWRVADASADDQQLPLVRLGHSRVMLAQTDSWQFTMTRHAMMDVEGDIDCAQLNDWTAAATACASLLRGTATVKEAAEWSLLFRAAMGSPLPSFFFGELTIQRVDPHLTQSQVHGLLGQRALLRPEGPGTRAKGSPVAEAAGEEVEGTQEHVPPTMRIGVASSGGVGVVGAKRPDFQRRFGSQGEGAIEGSFRAYIRADLHDRRGFAYSMWEGCEAGI